MNGKRRKNVVLYNPQAVFYTMPLALVAVGSALDSRRYEVRIVDGRLERDPVGAVLAEIDDALCLGVSGSSASSSTTASPGGRKPGGGVPCR